MQQTHIMVVWTESSATFAVAWCEKVNSAQYAPFSSATHSRLFSSISGWIKVERYLIQFPVVLNMLWFQDMCVCSFLVLETGAQGLIRMKGKEDWNKRKIVFNEKDIYLPNNKGELG